MLGWHTITRHRNRSISRFPNEWAGCNSRLGIEVQKGGEYKMAWLFNTERDAHDWALEQVTFGWCVKVAKTFNGNTAVGWVVVLS